MNDTILELRKFVAPEFVFGIDALDLTGQYARNYGGKKALVVTDSGVAEAGWTKKIVESLIEKNIKVEIYSKVSQNPREDEVMEGAELYRTSGCNLIVAVGGGSPIDCAKGIGIVVANNKHILEFEGVDQINNPIPPLICVPTTGGTSADVSQFSIITDQKEKVKISIVSKAIIPDISLIDPQTLLTMDNYLTACTGIDAMVHAFEAYVSNASSAMTDMHALKAIEILAKYLIPSLQEPNNLEYRSQVMFASLEAGLAFSNASLGVVHSMAHSLGGLLDLPHGECNALLFNHVINYNFSEAEEKYVNLARIFNIDFTKMTASEKKSALFNLIQSFREKAGITNSLNTRGVKTGDIPPLAKKALADVCSVTNPRRPVQRDIEVIYEEAL